MLKILSFILFLLVTLQASFAKTVKVMSYNVENLFDVEHDSGKEDYTFLPMNHPAKAPGCETIKVEHYKKECLETDWTADKLEIKLTQIEKVVKSTQSIPDILALIEVENPNVVQKVQKRLGYKHLIMTNSPDARGIDVAVLFNPSPALAFVSTREIKLKTSQFGIRSATRNVLEVTFKLAGKPFFFYLNHWPSQQSGPGSRVSAAEQVMAVVKDKINAPDTRVMLVGDFNVTDTEKPNPIYDMLTKNTGLFDIAAQLTPAQRKKLPPGTYFYGWEWTWNFLDKIIVNENFLKSAPGINAKNFNIYAPQFMTRIYEGKNPDRPGFGQKAVVPWNYWHNAYTIERAGFSDHFPVTVEITL